MDPRRHITVFGWAEGDHNIVFYAEDERIAGHNPIWVQKTLTAMVRMFDRVGLQKNLGKTKSMVCTPGFVWGQQEAAEYKTRAMVEGDTVRYEKRTRVICV